MSLHELVTQTKKPVLNPKHKNWEAAKEKVKLKEATFESLNKHYSITQENFDLLCLG